MVDGKLNCLAVEVSEVLGEGSGNSTKHNIDITVTGGQDIYVNGVAMDKVRLTIEGDWEYSDFADHMDRLFGYKKVEFHGHDTRG